MKKKDAVFLILGITSLILAIIFKGVAGVSAIDTFGKNGGWKDIGDWFKNTGNDIKHITIADDSDKVVIDNSGIHVADGDNKVAIDKNGIHVEGDDSKVEIDNKGIHIKDEDDKVAIDKDGIHVDDGDVDITIETEEDN